MKKKIGIITYHFAQNYGAVWQCFALQEYLRKIGNDVYVLNAITEKQKRNNSLFHKRKGIKNLITNICLFPFCKSRYEKAKKFKKFVINYLHCTSLVCNEYELEQLVNNNKFDILISGSDQVWNPQIPDFEKMFFLPFKSIGKKIGYSVSIGRAKLDEIIVYRQNIKDFLEIGVRELGAIDTLKKVVDKTMVNTVDPVLLLSKNEWMKFINLKFNYSGYLLCYFLDKKNIKESLKLAKKIAKQKNLKIRCISMHFNLNSFKKMMVNNAGPIDFLNYIYHADTVITDGYHGTVFSTIYNKEFYSIIHNKSSADSRIKDYLSILGLKRRIIYHNTEKFDDNCINYENVQKLIEKIPMNSYNFLDKAINNQFKKEQYD